MSDAFNIETDLLTSPAWPHAVAQSSNMPVLQRALRLAIDLEEVEGGDSDIDDELQYLFTRFSRLIPDMPDPEIGRPQYTRHAWDLRALHAMIPTSMQFHVRQLSALDKHGSTRWMAALYDLNGSRDSNAITFDHSDGYGSAWTPNLALARLLITWCIASVIQKTLASSASSKRAA